MIKFIAITLLINIATAQNEIKGKLHSMYCWHLNDDASFYGQGIE